LGTFVDDPADMQYVDLVRKMCASMHVGRIAPRMAKLASLRGLLTGEALTLPFYRDAGLRAWIEHTCRTASIDGAMIFSSAMAQYADALPAISTLLVFDDVDSAKWTQYAEHHRWPMSSLYRREGRELLAFERASAAAAKCTFFVTDKEADLFRGLAPECADRVDHICNGVDSDFFSPHLSSDSPFPQAELAIAFTGAMDYWPNVDAVVWFAREALPALLSKWPRLKFYIVGRSPAPAVQALASASIVVTGTVPDVRPYLRHALMVVAPLRLARGIQNKILEAMAMGKAVIASDSCAAALNATPGVDYLTAADAAEFVNRVDDLLRAPERALAIGIAARDTVVSRYSWAAHLSGFDKYLPAGSATTCDNR
jgi:sugar transferase (PEP-CTERM/EpsH1 system associated)